MTVQIGTQFRSHYADANPLWEVTDRLGDRAWQAVVVNEPIEIDGVMYDSDYVGVARAFHEKEIEAHFARERFWEQAVKERAAFWDSVAVGDTLHYHHGFGAYVRNEVVEHEGEKQLRPIALVGQWRDYDVVRRWPDGSISHGYHAKKVLNNDDPETWSQANPSTIYEAPGFSTPRGEGRDFDPRTLEPLDLTPPPMTEEEAERAKMVRFVNELREVLEPRDPDESLERLELLLERGPVEVSS